MRTLVCDVCKKTIQNPIHERTYYIIKEWEICEPCKEDMDAALKPIVRTKSPFSYEWYERLISDDIEKACQKNRFAR